MKMMQLFVSWWWKETYLFIDLGIEVGEGSRDVVVGSGGGGGVTASKVMSHAGLMDTYALLR